LFLAVALLVGNREAVAVRMVAGRRLAVAARLAFRLAVADRCQAVAAH
jgi:hypothetical protein